MRREARLEARKNARQRVIEPRVAKIAVKAAAIPARAASPAVSPAPATAVSPAESLAAAPVKAVENAASVLYSNVVPPPPGPVLINTVTYDFGRGVKTTSLRDGAVFVESFDPQAFFRIVPEPGPNVTASINTPALADARKP